MHLQWIPGESLKISCFLIDKFELTTENIIFFKYGTEIEKINIETDVYSFGTKASVIINDFQGSLGMLMDYQSNFYFVIAIFNVLDSEQTEDGSIIEKGILYQPYIFETESVELLSPSSSVDRVYRLHLLDLVSASLKKVSYGNLLLEQPGFPNLSNFKEVYTALIDYAALIINLLHDKKYKIPREIYLGGSINDSVNVLVKDVVLKDVTIDTSLYNLINRIYKMASREIEAPAEFKSIAVVNGLISTPLFLNNEWEDIEGYYRMYYKDHDNDSVEEKITYSGDNRSIEALMFRRNWYLKHLQMPFQLAFDAENPRIYETINPKLNEDRTISDEELIFNPLNGYTMSTLNDVVEIPIDQEMSGLLWKNISIMSDGAEGSSNALLYFNWIYEYYKYAYLNQQNSFLRKKLNKMPIPPVDPYFLKLERLNLTGGDKEKFAKMNSITVRLRSSDPVKEAFWHVGRSIKSYVFLNSLFGFKINGNIIRHPGEIIKININSDENKEAMTLSSPIGGATVMENGYVLAYITNVNHEFSGGTYSDIIHATKICSVGDYMNP